MADIGAEEKDFMSLGQFLREINSGRSIDCLPQGLYPTKMIGNDFLRFIDNFHGLKSEVMIRFMDDMYLFDDNEKNITSDFLLIQKLLGDKGLSLNPNKTFRAGDHGDFSAEVDEVKRALLRRRRNIVTIGYDENENEITKEQKINLKLSNDELNYILELLKKENLEEEDVELVLTIMGEYPKEVAPRLGDMIVNFPHLIKSIYGFCKFIENKDELADIILNLLSQENNLQEFQLFWVGWIIESHLINTKNAARIIDLTFNHRNASVISRSKILEIGDARYGLSELRAQYLGAGQSDWLSWSSAVGSRTLSAISRNHRLTYFGKSSQMNQLIYSVLTK